MKPRLETQRTAYALRRMSLAVDRLIRKEVDQQQGELWVNAWAKRAGIKQQKMRFK